MQVERQLRWSLQNSLLMHKSSVCIQLYIVTCLAVIGLLGSMGIVTLPEAGYGYYYYLAFIPGIILGLTMKGYDFQRIRKISRLTDYHIVYQVFVVLGSVVRLHDSGINGNNLFLLAHHFSYMVFEIVTLTAFSCIEKDIDALKRIAGRRQSTYDSIIDSVDCAAAAA